MIHDTNNTALEHEFNHLALNLRNMWYQHGYTGLRYFRQHIAEIHHRFQHLLDEDRIDPETLRAAVGACDDLLALKMVPNESWLPYVAGIRRRVSQASPTVSNASSPEDSPLEEKGFATFDTMSSAQSGSARPPRRASS